MINFVFLSIPCTTTYEGLKRQQKFPEDTLGVSNWVMKFPLVIYSANLKQKHIFREGEVQITSVSQPNLQQKWKYFVMTNSNGRRYYCTSQIFYEKTPLLRKNNSLFSTLSESYSEFYIPKCLVIISQLPYFKLHVNLLKVHRQLRKKNPSISCAINQELYHIYLQLIKEKKQSQWERIQVPQSRMIDCPIQIPFEYYVECSNSITTGQILYLERSTNREVLHLYQLNPQTLYQFSYYFHLPLTSTTLRVALSAILQEKQIIFVSNNQNLNVMLIQTLMQMILPFKWHHMYAPNLPYDMLQAAEESFMPYIVGIQKKYLNHINCSQRVIIDVDSDNYAIHTKLQLLPQSYEKYFMVTSNNKNYLEWQRQVRINSICFILDLLSQNSQYDKMLYLAKDKKDYFIQSLKYNVRPFYQEFIKKSMLFNKFIEDKYQDLFKEISHLLSLYPEERKLMLMHRFNILRSQTLNPLRLDNQKCWIKFYQRYSTSRKRFGVSSKSISSNNNEVYRSALLSKPIESSTSIRNIINRSTIRL